MRESSAAAPAASTKRLRRFASRQQDPDTAARRPSWTARHDRCRRSLHPERSGVIVLWSSIALIMALMCTALAVNAVRISGIRADHQGCLDAAGLAAAHHLLSDQTLRQHVSAVEQTWLTQNATAKGQEIVAAWRIWRTVPLPSQLDLAFRRVPDESGNSAFEAVHARFRDDRSTPHAPLFFAGLTGVVSAGIPASSNVMIDHRLTGLRPGNNLTIPMVPFCLFDDETVLPDESWTTAIEQFEGPDRLAWSDEQRRVVAGPDGLPELTFTLTAGSSPQASQLFAFADSDRSATLQALIRDGVGVTQIASLQQTELNFPSLVPISEWARDEQFDALQELTGLMRIVCLAEIPRDDANSQNRYASLIRPVAARFLLVERNASDNQVHVTLQPCVVASKAVVTQPGAARNRYLCNIRLDPGNRTSAASEPATLAGYPQPH